MAGYSGTPLAKKLGIKPGSAVAMINAPPNFEALLEGLPRGVALARKLTSQTILDVIILFAASAKELHHGFPACQKRLCTAGGLWLSWPKQASGIETDLNEGIVRNFGLASGLVDNKVCAIDDSWSGLRFVVRLKDRPKH
jgi:hypothetical protein